MLLRDLEWQLDKLANTSILSATAIEAITIARAIVQATRVVRDLDGKTVANNLGDEIIAEYHREVACSEEVPRPGQGG